MFHYFCRARYDLDNLANGIFPCHKLQGVFTEVSECMYVVWNIKNQIVLFLSLCVCACVCVCVCGGGGGRGCVCVYVCVCAGFGAVGVVMMLQSLMGVIRSNLS